MYLKMLRTRPATQLSASEMGAVIFSLLSYKCSRHSNQQPLESNYLPFLGDEASLFIPLPGRR